MVQGCTYTHISHNIETIDQKKTPKRTRKEQKTKTNDPTKGKDKPLLACNSEALMEIAEGAFPFPDRTDIRVRGKTKTKTRKGKNRQPRPTSRHKTRERQHKDYL
jgi:hypothetical protein